MSLRHRRPTTEPPSLQQASKLKTNAYADAIAHAAAAAVAAAATIAHPIAADAVAKIADAIVADAVAANAADADATLQQNAASHAVACKRAPTQPCKLRH